MEFKVLVKKESHDKINELLLKLFVRCDFQIMEHNDKFTKLRLKNTNDKYMVLP